MDLVLRKFKSNTRYCGYQKKEEYKHIVERNKEIYLSSAYYRHHWAYAHFIAFLNGMASGGSYFTCCLPYQLAVMENIKNIDEMTEEYNEDTTDELMWEMEYECKWIGENDGSSFFKYDKLETCRTVNHALYPKEIMDNLDITDKFFAKQNKKQGDIRIVFVDIARKESVSGGENDATSIGVMNCSTVVDNRLKTSYFMREVQYLETSTGQNTVLQTLRIRKLYEWFDCDYIVIDCQSIGGSIVDQLAIGITDPEDGTEYSALNCINHEALKLGTILFPNAPKVVYGIMGSPKLNSDIGYAVRDILNTRRLRFLCDETSSRQHLSKIKEYELLTADMKGKLMQPYVQISALVNEMISLEYKISPDTNLLRLSEKSGMRKDRYMSMAYGLWYSTILEKDLFAPKNKFDDIDDWVSFEVW